MKNIFLVGALSSVILFGALGITAYANRHGGWHFLDTAGAAGAPSAMIWKSAFILDDTAIAEQAVACQQSGLERRLIIGMMLMWLVATSVASVMVLYKLSLF